MCIYTITKKNYIILYNVTKYITIQYNILYFISYNDSIYILYIYDLM